MINEELLAKKAIKIWESTEGSYIDIEALWEDEWADTWKEIVKVVIQAQSTFTEAQN